jgi:thiol-disulfide isomerase/thioredoxin/tetratricopeptide (TPR) repeat protein
MLLTQRYRSRPGARLVLLAALAAALLPLAPAGAQGVSDSSAVRLRTLYFQRDYETGALEGARLVANAPGDVPLQAWYVLNLARTERVDEAVAAAKTMIDSAPRSGWSWFAHAGALLYKGGRVAEAIDAAAQALTLLPGHRDAVWIRANTLASDPARREEAIAFVAAQRARLQNAGAELIGVKAYAFYVMAIATTPPDESKLKAAFDAYAEARQADPSSVNAHYAPATYLTSLKRVDEAYALLKRAVALAPGSRDVHQAYWAAIRAHPNLTPAQKDAEVEADLSPFLEAHGNRPGALLAASYAARDLKQPERQRQIEDTILQKFNNSREAEWVLIYRLREFRTPESIGRPDHKKLLREYVARPKHYHEGLLGETYRNLFFQLVNDASVTSDELLRVADGMTRYETTNVHISYVGAAIALADKKIQLQKAEQIARDSIAALKARVERDRGAYRSDKEFEDRLKSAPAIGHDALGWVLFVQGRRDEAEQELLKAYELNPSNRDNLHHLGRFYEAKNDIPRAEWHYVKGLAVQSPGTNPSEAALRALYEKRHGSADGYDAYLTEIRDRDRVARREKILTARIAAPASPPAFNLRTLDGKRVSLDSLKGKVVVINFWGIWCGWCVKELPEFQKLHEKYASDPDIAILTIDNDQNPDDVPPWMKRNSYTFPVLFDDGYVKNAGVHAFPTTWFLDRQGRKVFEKVGWSEKLLEEFGWRVEAIRGSVPAPAPSDRDRRDRR